MITTDFYARPWLCLALAIALILFGASSGCTVTQDAQARLAVQYATLKAIEGDENPAAKAARIIDLAETAIALTDSADAVSVVLIESAVRQRINWGALPLTDRIAADALITALRTEIESRVGAGELDADALVPVRTILRWVIEAARHAIPHAAPR